MRRFQSLESEGAGSGKKWKEKREELVILYPAENRLFPSNPSILRILGPHASEERRRVIKWVGIDRGDLLEFGGLDSIYTPPPEIKGAAAIMI
jgi:hypothetical protein